MATMNKVVRLNTAKTTLAITKIVLLKTWQKIIFLDAKLDDNNLKLNDIDMKLKKNNVKLYGFQNLVVALYETVSSMEIKVSKHETDILKYRAKVTQITMDYIK